MRGIQMLAISGLICCCSAPAYPVDTLSIRLPGSQRELLVVALKNGSQITVKKRECSQHTSDEQWSKHLAGLGFDVENGNQIVDLHDGLLYALRFKQGGIYGDMTIYPVRSPKCQDYIVRLQRASPGAPMSWNDEYSLSSLSILFQGTNGYLFKDEGYPPGYP